MKVLVFDDNSTNRKSAKAQLGEDHDLTVVSTYDEAQELLLPQRDEEAAKQLFVEKYGDENPRKRGIDSDLRSERISYWYDTCIPQTMIYPDFDVVLVDLLVPASSQQMGREGQRLAGTEMSVGVFIGLLAGAQAGVDYAAVFTDSSHHDHPASACFDAFNEHESHPTPFFVNDTKTVLSNTRNWVNKFDPSDLSRKLEYEEYKNRDDVVRAKNWRALLDYLLEAEVELPA